MKLKYVAIFLVLLCCLMGAASAAEDISTDAVDDAIDDVVITDEAVDEDLPTDDIISAEPADAGSDMDQSDAAIDAYDEEGNTRASGTQTVSNWSDLKTYAETSGTDYTINLNGVINISTGDIQFKNNAIVQGNANSYITGNAANRIPFKSTYSNALQITFKNVKFQNINCQMLIQLQTTGTSKLENCTFINITAGTGHDSVVYNNKGTMNMTNCTFTNCTAGYGAVTNYMWGSTTGVTLNVKGSKFENNHASEEPGAINNCGILTVYNCTFNNNSADLWAGAIHTHSNANTVINLSTFKNNVAEWNGGALYTYSTLKVYNSLFENNVCHSDTGGGAIGSYNYGSTYDIYIENCTFKNNTNDCTGGHGGAITALNGGYLNVYNSTFISNYADIGQAICAYNQHIENGTGGKPYLAIEGCNFTNHTGSSDTVYISGRVNSFKNNIFVNSTQNTHWGSGNTYNSINLPTKNKLLSSSFNEDILKTETTVSSDDGLFDAFKNLEDGDKIIVTEGVYSLEMSMDDLWGLDDGNRFILEGNGNVVFNMASGFNIDPTCGACPEGYNDLYLTTSISNIVFDCDVIVGSNNFTFNNCKFNKGFKVTYNYQQPYNNKIYITFNECQFAFNEEDIQSMDYANLIFNDCKFPVTAVDSVVDISSPEKGVVVVTLTDNSSAPIAGATFKYTVNGVDEQTATTGDDGKYSITGLTGEVTIAVNYEGNESFNAISDTKSFNFTEEPVVPAKVATKITAPKVSAVYNVAKKLVITLTDKDGKALANKKVTVKVGTIIKTLTTNAKGQVSLNVATLVPKTYTATVKFAGDDAYLASSVSPKVVVSKAKPKITAKAKTFKVKVKTKKYTVTLKNNKGKVMKKVKLTLKVGKKTYKATTNSKGKATFKITKLTKKGKYTATIKFAGSKYYKALSKKAKITVKK